MIDEYKKVYGLDFIERKQYYENIIRNTKTDFEFFCTMDAIIQDIPSFHTDLVFPEMIQYKSLNCYNSKSIIAQKNMGPYCDYWNSLIKKECETTSDVQFTCFNYFEGNYVFNPFESNNENIEEKSVLISVSYNFV